MLRPHRRTARVALLFVFGILLAPWLIPMIAAAQPGPAAAWQKVREAGSYQFSADITQITAPIASASSVGQQSRQERLYLEGQTNLTQQAMNFTLWSQGGSIANKQGGVEIKIENEQAFARQNSQDWQPINDFSAAFAPSGDFLAFLSAARDITSLGPQDYRGQTIERYGFRIDGPAFAEAMRLQAEEFLRAQGKLPPNLQLKPSEDYKQLSGQGELWIDSQGLPLRQTLALTFPPLPDRQLNANITVDFSNFGAIASSPISAASVNSFTAAARDATKPLALISVVGMTCFLLVRYGRSRQLYRALVATLILSTVLSPVLQGEPERAFASEQQAKAAEQQQRSEQSDMTRTINTLHSEAQNQQTLSGPAALQAIRSDTGQDLDFDGLSDVQEQFLGTNPLTADAETLAQQTSLQALAAQSTVDSDGDGLTDYEETLLGTSSSTADDDRDGVPDGRDSDNDGVSDYDETVGFVLNGTRYYSDPLRADSNDDSIDDGREWNRDTDNDGVPDIQDLDNDGDGVPDNLDLSPFQKQTTSFSQSNPFGLSISNLDPNSISYVEFQLRPTNAKHLWYSSSVLDWPRDSEGQIADVDSKTFADVNPNSARPADSNGDVRLVPMLEIQMPGSASNLPLANPKVTLPLAEASSDAAIKSGGPSGISGSITLTQQGNNLQLSAGIATPYQKFYDLIEGSCDAPVRRLTNTIIVNSQGLGTISGRSLAALADGNHAVVAWQPGAPPPDIAARYVCATIPPLPVEGSKMVDTTLYDHYAISVRQQSSSTRLAYVPLQLVTDQKSGEQVAFAGKMLYQANASGWGAAHQVRLVWMVQALIDQNCRVNGTTYICDGYNQQQVVHSYYDDWQLTGMNVREDHGVDVAFINEDPTVDTNLNSDDALVRLSTGLDHSFLSGRDCDTQTTNGVCQGNGQLDLTTAEIARRFNRTTNTAVSAQQRWNIENILQVQTKRYPHIDAALMGIASGDTRDLVLSKFPTTGAVVPTVMFAREERFRTLNLDVQTQGSVFQWAGTKLTVDFGANGGIQERTIAGLNWAPYKYNTSSATWEAAPIESYWNDLKTRYNSAFDDEIAAGTSDADTAAGKVVFFQLYYLSLYSGAISTVKIGNTILKSASVLPDKPMAATIIGGGVGPGIKYLANAAFLTLYSQTVTEKGLKGFYQFLSGFAKEATAAATLVKAYNFIKWSSWTSSVKAFLSRSVLIGAVIIGVVLLATWGATMLALHLKGEPWVKTAFAITAAVLIGAVMTFLMVIKPIISAVQVAKSLATEGVSVVSAFFEVMSGASSAIGASAAAAVIGLIIQIGVIWGVVIYQLASGAVAAGSIQANLLIANSIGSTLVAVLFFVLSLTVAGMILVGLISVIDTILTVLCQLGIEGSCWGISSFLTQMIANIVYDYQPLLKVKDNSNMVQIQNLNIVLDDPNRGLVDGNIARVRTRIRTNIEQQLPTGGSTGSVVYHAQDYLNEANLRSTAFTYRLSDASVAVTPPARNSMTSSWFDLRYSTIYYTLQSTFTREDRSSRLYSASAEQDVTSDKSATLKAGLNQSLPAKLTTAYTIPAVECWGAGYLSTCKDQTISGSNTAEDMGLKVDVFPATLDTFAAFAWDSKLPAPLDKDGDGLIATSAGGNDPNDNAWDSDGDGLTDRVEMELRADGLPISLSSKDTDGDGLSDSQEVRLGTNPALADSDGDGLNDSQEINGWLFTYNTGKQTRVFSNPLVADTDQDGMSDKLEKDLHERDPKAYPFNPRVINDAPIALSTQIGDADGFVKAGQTFAFTSTVRNTLDSAQPLGVSGTQSHDMPSQISGGSSAPFNVQPGQSASNRSNLSVNTSGLNGVLEFMATANASVYENSVSSSWNWSERISSSRSSTAGTPWYSKIAAAPLAKWSQPYLIAVLQGSAGAENSTTVSSSRIAVYSSDGTLAASSPSILVDDGSAAKANNPPAIVCADPSSGNDGACLVVWSEQRNGNFDIVGALVRPGLAASAPFVIASDAADDLRPAVAGSAGGFLVAWERAGALYARALIGTSYTLGTEQRFDQNTPNGTMVDANVDLAYAEGQYRAAWENYAGPGDSDVWTALLDVSGQYVAGSAQPVATTAASEDSPRLAYDPYDVAPFGSHTYASLIVYRDSTGLRGRMARGNTVLPNIVSIASRGTADALLAPQVSRDNLNTGWSVSWLAQSGSNYAVRYQSVELGGTLRGSQQSFVYQSKASGSWQQLVPSARGTSIACGPNSCAIASNVAPWNNPTAQNSLFIDQISIVRNSVNTGSLTLQMPSRITVDSDAPSSTISSFFSNNYFRSNTVGIIGGTAADPTSYADHVDVRVDGGAWAAATGAANWSYALTIPAGEGYHSIESRATDAVGNSQTTFPRENFLVDNSAPTVDGNNIWSAGTRIQNTPTLVAGRDANQHWIVPFNGTAADVVLPGGISGSGTQVVEVLLQPSGTWQSATVNGSNWSLNYQLTPTDAAGNPMAIPNGTYTVYVRATDRVGNTTDQAQYATQTLKIDNTAPLAKLTNPASNIAETPQGTFVLTQTAALITDTITLGGTVTEPNSVRSGIRSLDIAFNPADLGVAPGNWRARYFNNTALSAQPALVRADEKIDFDWGTGSPHPSVNADNFAVEWARTTVFRVSGTYRFSAARDGDGRVQAFLDGNLVLDNGAASSADVRVTSGLHALRVVYTEGSNDARAQFNVALQQADWLPTTLAQSGNGVLDTTWSSKIPADMEGIYQIDLRGTDVLNNVNNDKSTWNTWRGEIDTAAPRVSFEVEFVGVGSSARTLYRVWATDFNLTEQGFVSPCTVEPDDRYYYDTSWWGDWFKDSTRLYQIYSECSVAGHKAVWPTVTAYDKYGRSTSVGANASQPPNQRGLYWTDGDKIHRFDLDSDEITTIADTKKPVGIAVDINNAKVYWSDQSDSGRAYPILRWANLDGSDQRTSPYVAALEAVPGRMAIDSLRGLVWWQRFDGYTPVDYYLNGVPNPASYSYGEALINGNGIAINPVTGWQYLRGSDYGVFVTYNTLSPYRQITRGNSIRISDGSTPTTASNGVVQYTAATRDIVYDPKNRNFYFVTTTNQVRRVPFTTYSNSDSNPTDYSVPLFIPGSAPLGANFQPQGIALDVPANKIYISDAGNGKIWRANLDGTSIEQVADAPNSLAVALDINYPPVANNQTIKTPQNTAVTFTLDVADPNVTPLRYTFSAKPSHGILTGLPAEGTFQPFAPTLVYTPEVGFVGSEMLAYTAIDGRGATGSGVVVITVESTANVLISLINSPNDGAVITTSGPITISGGATATNGLKSLSLTANGSVIGTKDWSTGPAIVDATWSIIWTPPGEGRYTLVPTLTARDNAVQTSPQQIQIIVDYQPPTVAIATTVITRSNLLGDVGVVKLNGSASDVSGIRSVQIQNGSATSGAVLGSTNCTTCVWSLNWPIGYEPDGASFPITARATDGAGQVSTTNRTVTVDLKLPTLVTQTLSYRNTLGATMPITQGDTIRDAQNPPQLSIDWTPSSDGSGIAGYRAGWTSSPTPSLGLLTAYAANATLHHVQTVGEAQVLYGHVVSIDNRGNQRWQTVGPVYIDAPTTADIISDPAYRGWQQSGASQIGADRAASRLATAGTVQEPQRFYTTWDASALAMAWTGANWNTEGDLYIYLDTKTGGTDTAYNPYSTPITVKLPRQNGQQLLADYLVQVEDSGVAKLLAWNGSTWAVAATFATSGAPNPVGPPLYRFDTTLSPAQSMFYLPWNLLGVSNPSSTTMRMVAFATEEDALRLWAAAPDKNPLNSARVLNPLVSADSITTFTLTQQYDWASLGANIRPNAGQFSDADLQLGLDNDAGGVLVGFLNSGLYQLLTPGTPIDANLDGTIDQPLPINREAAPLGNGATVRYTLNYVNTGTEVATNVRLVATGRGALKLPGGTQTVVIGNVAPGEAGSAQFTATIDTSLSTTSAELNVAVADRSHGDFDWFWVQHDIDVTAPSVPAILSPAKYAAPGNNTVLGTASDPSGVAQIELEATPLAGGAATVITCADSTPNDSQWACNWDAGTTDQQFRLRARATDRWGNQSAWSASVTVTVDTTAPTISLDGNVETRLQTDFLRPGSLQLQGEVNDNHQADHAELCGVSANAACATISVLPGTTPSGTWKTPLQITRSGDGIVESVALAGVDGVGNHSVTPLIATYHIDDVAPLITATQQLTQVLLADYWALAPMSKSMPSAPPVLRGTFSDGGGIAAIYVRSLAPDGTTLFSAADFNSGTWSFTPRFQVGGIYSLMVEAIDLAGNSHQIGPFGLNVTATVDLTISKTHTPSVPVAGQILNYTLTITNNGVVDATNLVISDVLPSGLGYISASPSGICNANGQTITCRVARLNVGATTSVVLNTLVYSWFTGPFTNTAQVSADQTEYHPADNSASDPATAIGIADLVVSKSADKATAAPGEPLRYTITVRNNGPSDARGVRFTDTLPAELRNSTWTCVASTFSTCSTTGGSGSIDTLIDVGNQSTVTFTVDGTIDSAASGSITNIAKAVAPAEITESNTGNNTSSVNTTLVPHAELAISKTGPANATPGAPITYTVVVANAGPSDARNTRVRDTFPATLGNIRWECTASLGSSCSADGQDTLDTLVDLKASGAITFTVQADIASNATGALTNSASVAPAAGVTENDSTNNSASTTATLEPRAELTISKTGPASATPGMPITYTIVISNTGPSDAPGTIVNDTLPVALTDIRWECAASAGSSCPASGSGSFATTVDLLAGGKVTFTVTARIKNDVTGIITNVATTSTAAGIAEADTSNNSASASTTLVPRAELQISKTGPGVAIPGTPITYTLVVTNTGPSVAPGTIIRDTLPTALANGQWECTVSIGSSCPASGQGSLNSTAELQVGGTATFTITADIDSTATGTIANTASVTPGATVAETTTSDNSATVTTVLEPHAALGISKTGPAVAIPGTPITYTITISNTGPSAAPGTKVRDLLPSSLHNATWECQASNGSSCSASGSTQLDTTVDLLAGGTATFTVTAKIDNSATGTITNQAEVAAATSVIDPDTTDNSASVATVLEPHAELAISKVGPASAIPGTPITYTITISNSGPSAAPGTLLTDTLPIELGAVTWVCQASTGSACPVSGHDTLNSLVDLRANGTATFTITAQIDDRATGSITNQAGIMAAPSVVEADTTNNTASATTTLEPHAELHISNSAPLGAVPGTPITYTVVISNTGPSAVQNAPINVSFAPELSGITWTCQTTADSSCAAPNGTGTLASAVNIRATGVATYTVTAQIASNATGTISSVATVNTPIAETDTTDNSATATTILGPTADLLVELNAPDNVRPGNLINYVFTIRNNGPSDVTGAPLHATLPAILQNLTWGCTAASSTNCAPISGSGPISLTLDLPRGGTATITATADVPLGSTGVVTSSVEITAPTGVVDPAPANNTVTARTAFEPLADLAVEGTLDRSTVLVGDTMVYTATITNHGDSDTVNTRLTIVLPTGGSAVALPTGCSVVGGTVECTLGSLANGTSTSVTFGIQIDSRTPEGSKLITTANVKSDLFDLDLANNTSETEATAKLHRAYAPLILRTEVQAPDLVVRQFVVTPNKVQIVIKNQGNVATKAGFWVDLYVAPNPVPTGVNQVWYDGRSKQGAVWGVENLQLAPGAEITLDLQSPSFRAQYSQLGTLALGTPAYVQVDSANTATTYGGVQETHEITGAAYNNIAKTTVVANASTSATRNAPAALSGPAALPDRQIPASSR